MIPDEKPILQAITTAFQPNSAKTEICWFHLSPHKNNRKQIQYVDPVDQLKYLDGEDW
jgi:CHASE1-domain containing sensor protein